jgi:hypothetical protein
MTHVQHTTFTELDEDAFKTYSQNLIDARGTAAERQAAFSYIQQIVSKDESLLSTERSTFLTRKRAQKARKIQLESLIREADFDYSIQNQLFQDEVISDAVLLARLLANNAKVYTSSRTINADIQLTGDNILFDGSGAGDARSGTLQSTTVVNGVLKIAGDNCVVRGVKFNVNGEFSIQFTGPCNNFTLQDCIFEAGSVADRKWWWGGGNNLGGDILIKNNVAQNYVGTWYFGDANTDSNNTGTVAIRDFTMTENKFDNISGSFAVRGLSSDPIRKATITKNVFNHPTPHSLFWDSIEVSGGVKKVLCTDNVGTIGAKGAKNGFIQLWSKSSKPWKVKYTRNVLTGYRVGFKIAMSQPTFFAPDSGDDYHLIKIRDNDLTDVDYGASFLYKNVSSGSSVRWVPQTPAGDYDPGNKTTFPSAPPIEKPSGVTIVTF